MKLKLKLLLFLAGFLIVANFFVWQEVLNHDGTLKVVFFNIGQGDSIFIETPEKRQILIDGGPDKGLVLEKLANEMPFWDRTIDLVVLTHPDSDHRRGILSVLEKYQVDYFLTTDFAQEKLLSELGHLLGQTKQVIGHDGLQISTGRTNFLVLGHLLGQDSNDSSLVLKMNFLANSFLFTGDISSKVEKDLLENQALQADVLKVAHHGSRTSTSNEFLRGVSPAFAVISCGKDNSYHHPHQEVLQRLEDFGIKILRTDLSGDIEIVADGNNLETINNL